LFTGNKGHEFQFLVIFKSLKEYFQDAHINACIDYAMVLEHPGELIAFDSGKIKGQADYAAKIIDRQEEKFAIFTHSMGSVVALEALT
jgi:alpha-beta hydrolase superfamily lysophospholipase